MGYAERQKVTLNLALGRIMTMKKPGTWEVTFNSGKTSHYECADWAHDGKSVIITSKTEGLYILLPLYNINVASFLKDKESEG